VKEDQVLYIDPLSIKVKDGLDRFRKDLGDLKDLGKSLREAGQIQPAVINRKHELIAGGRRVAACILEGLKVKVIYSDLVEPTKMRLWELEENLHRANYTPAEYALAVEELHKLMQGFYGESTSGKEGGHTLDSTAKILGKTRGSVISELELAEMVKAFPELKGAKKKSEIVKATKGLQKLQVAMTSLKDYEEIVAEKKDLFKLHNIDAVEHMRRPSFSRL
jgi:ParB/RepB/Spo0J family partition protein